METTKWRGNDGIVFTELLFLETEMRTPVTECAIADRYLVLPPFLTGIVKVNVHWIHVLLIVRFLVFENRFCGGIVKNTTSSQFLTYSCQ